MLARRELIRLVEFIRPAVEKYQRETSSILSFFEVYTALALVYFSQRELDCVVLETGLGGRLDATNAAQAAVCGITPISLEHTQQLGSTLSRIAREKAGIIKKGACVISAVQTPEAAQVIKDRCNRMGARLYQVGEEIMVSPQTRNINRQTFAVKGLVGQYPGLYTRLAGSYQPMNAAVAVGMAESAVKVGLRITTPAIKRGITSARWPGRMEIFRDGCFVVLDGALNVSSTLTLIESLDYYFGTPGLIVVLGLCEDKDIPGVCGIWKERARGVILTQADNPRAVPAQSLASYFSSSRILSVTRSVPRAVAWASSQVQKGEVAVVSGSLFVVAEARRYLLKRLKRNEDKQ
jgi:dihydrofolate synthase/folylpolyglutamate synthase